MVFCRICLEEGSGSLMACRAVMRRRLSYVSDFKRHMNRMAGEAGLKLHIFCVFFVTHHAFRDLSVCCMTLAASHIRMSAGVILHLFTLLLVTRETRFANVAFQLQIKRGMGVGVTA